MTLREHWLRWRQLANVIGLTARYGVRAFRAGQRDPGGTSELGVAREYALRVLDCLGLVVEVEGAEHARALPPYAVASTHASYLDPVVLAAHFPAPLGFIAKREVAWVPIIGGHVRRTGLLIDRRKGESAKMALRRAVSRHAAGHWLIFPEGTRTKDGEIQRFRRGGLSTLLEAGLVIVPVCLTGTYYAYSRHARFVRHDQPLRMTICPPVRRGGFTSIEEAVLEIEARVRRARGEVLSSSTG